MRICQDMFIWSSISLKCYSSSIDTLTLQASNLNLSENSSQPMRVLLSRSFWKFLLSSNTLICTRFDYLRWWSNQHGALRYILTLFSDELRQGHRNLSKTEPRQWKVSKNRIWSPMEVLNNKIRMWKAEKYCRKMHPMERNDRINCTSCYRSLSLYLSPVSVLKVTEICLSSLYCQ